MNVEFNYCSTSFICTFSIVSNTNSFAENISCNCCKKKGNNIGIS